LKQIIQSAESKIGAISVLDDDFAEQRQTIKGELEAKQLELATAITIQDAESVVV
jgi:hypothetical protein